MITSAEKDQLREALTQAFDEFIATLSSLDEASINRVPFTGSWTPAQVAGHIILATDGVPDHTTKPGNRPHDASLPAIRPWWEDMNQKFKAPQPLQPDDKPHTKQELLSELHRVREKDLSLLAQQDLTQLCMDFELPTVGYLTR